MLVLGLDTSTLTAGVAIIDDERVLADARHDASGRTNTLLVTIDRLCREANIAPVDLDAVAVGAGPGSFTGLRIGMATAKGIAFAAGRSLWAVSSLAALAYEARSHGVGQGVIVSVLDARRSEVFAGCYRADDLGPIDAERVLAPGELLRWAETRAAGRPVAYVGDAIDVTPELAALRSSWLPPRTPSGIAVARLALEGTRADVLVGGGPTYIRPSEAEVKYPDGVPGALRKPRP